jgi:very-short-patch-repair endonuclease
VTEKKTLKLPEPSEQTAEAPALKKKGRGWEISEKRLDALHEQAREMRRFPSAAHTTLAEKFSAADLGRYTFKRFAVVGSAIVDFNCHLLGMAIAIDEEGQNETLAKRRDKSLESVGIRVMRLKATDILENIDDVLARITAGMRLRIADKGVARRRHEEENPRQTKPRYDRDGNGPPRSGGPRPGGGKSFGKGPSGPRTSVPGTKPASGRTPYARNK